MHKPLSKKQIKDLQKKSLREINLENLEIIIMLQDLNDPVNVGSFFRIADAFAIKELALTNNTPTPPDPRLSMTARGMERRIEWKHFNTTEEAIEHYKNSGFEIVAVELTESSINYTKHKFKDRICLILGNEASGVYKKVLELCDSHVHIPMFGKGPSLNVTIAGAIVVSEVARQKS